MVQIQECSIDDVPILAEMNKHLIDDENAENSMNILQLERRMIDFINTDYKAFFFILNERIIGYGLCNINKSPIYLRQFFIRREERRKGYGKQAFHKLLEHIGINEIDIDVYAWNKKGIYFWESLGFKNRCFNMRYINN